MDWKKIFVPIIVILVLLLAVAGVYFIAPEAFDALEKIPDINVEMGNANINIGDIDIGDIDFEGGAPKFGFTTWTVICIVCIVLFFVLSMIHKVVAAILSAVSLAFPLIFGASIVGSYQEALEMGVSSADAAGVLVINIVLLGLVTFIAPAVLLACAIADAKSDNNIRHSSPESVAEFVMGEAQKRIFAIEKFKRAYENGMSLEELHESESYRYYDTYTYSAYGDKKFFAKSTPKQAFEIVQDLEQAKELYRKYERDYLNLVNRSEQQKKEDEKRLREQEKRERREQKTKWFVISIAVSLILAIVTTGLLVLGGYLMMLWVWPVALIVALNIVYILSITLICIILGMFTDLLERLLWVF